MAITNFSAVSASLGPSYRRSDQNRYVYEKFNQGQYYVAEFDGTDAVVTDAGINQLVGRSHVFQYMPEQAFAGTVPQVRGNLTGKGIDLQIDAADNDGIFFALPWTNIANQTVLLTDTAGPGAFTARTDGFFLRVKLQAGTVASLDELAVGFRKVQLFDTSAILSSGTAGSTDMAVLNVDNGTIKILTLLNTGTVSSTSTTMSVADATAVTLEVRVSEAGYVKFLVNGAAPTVDVTNFQFDSGDLLMPFISAVADAAAASTVTVLEWESGLLTERGLDGVNDLVN